VSRASASKQHLETRNVPFHLAVAGSAPPRVRLTARTAGAGRGRESGQRCSSPAISCLTNRIERTPTFSCTLFSLATAELQATHEQKDKSRLHAGSWTRRQLPVPSNRTVLFHKKNFNLQRPFIPEKSTPEATPAAQGSRLCPKAARDRGAAGLTSAASGGDPGTGGHREHGVPSSAGAGPTLKRPSPPAAPRATCTCPHPPTPARSRRGCEHPPSTGTHST